MNTEWSERSPEYRRRRNDRRNQRRKAVRFMQDLARALPCMDCGQRFPAVAMDFDHRPGVDKLSEVASLVGFLTVTWSRIQAETNKCDLVCSNCHRLRTFTRKQDDANSV